MTRPHSITAFFPAYNDGGTIPSMVLTALLTLRQVTDDYEIIVVNDGSSDYTPEVLEELASRYPELRVIHHPQNRGYGAALRTGFAAATKEWVFYTDGDAQYDPHELTALVANLDDGVDVVNGYKITRQDPISRRIIGRLYHHFVKLAFGFRLRDVDCDFRLIRRSIFDEIELESDTGTICLEMVKKFQDAGYVFAEVPVRHYHRQYGVSQFFNWRRLLRTARHLGILWWKLVVRKEHLSKDTDAGADAGRRRGRQTRTADGPARPGSGRIRRRGRRRGPQTRAADADRRRSGPARQRSDQTMRAPTRAADADCRQSGPAAVGADADRSQSGPVAVGYEQ